LTYPALLGLVFLPQFLLCLTCACIVLGDEFLNDCLVTYIESDIFDSIENEEIL